MSIVLFTVVTLMAQSYTVATVAGSDPVRDGGGAQNAILQNAVGLAVDAPGNLYIADATSNRVRKVIPDQMQQYAESAHALGKISTVVGLGGRTSAEREDLRRRCTCLGRTPSRLLPTAASTSPTQITTGS